MFSFLNSIAVTAAGPVLFHVSRISDLHFSSADGITVKACELKTTCEDEMRKSFYVFCVFWGGRDTNVT